MSQITNRSQNCGKKEDCLINDNSLEILNQFIRPQSASARLSALANEFR